MKIDKTYISNQNSYPGNNPVYIVIHNTDNFSKTADAKAHAKAQHDGNFDGMSAHCYVDDGDTAYDAMPAGRGAWHVGIDYGGKLFGKVNNRNSYGIEMCVNAGYNYEQAFQNLVIVTKIKMIELNVDASHVVSHYDVCAKNCPSQIRARGDWDRFKKLIGGADANISGVKIGDSNVEAISRVVYGEAGIIRSRESLVAVAQCIHDMLDAGGYGKTVTEVMKNNFAAYGSKETTDEARQAVYDVFVNGVRRFDNAKILQFRSFTNYSDGNGNIDKSKCSDLLKKYKYLGKDMRDTKWGHFYFGIKTATPEPLNKQIKVQCGAFTKKAGANELVKKLKAAGFSAVVKKDGALYRVQAGAFDIRKNAGALAEKLKASGFDAILK